MSNIGLPELLAILIAVVLLAVLALWTTRRQDPAPRRTVPTTPLSAEQSAAAPPLTPASAGASAGAGEERAGVDAAAAPVSPPGAPAGESTAAGAQAAPTGEAASTGEAGAVQPARKAGVPVFVDPADEETMAHPRVPRLEVQPTPEPGEDDDEPGLWDAESAAIVHLTEEEAHDAEPFEEVRDDQLHFDLDRPHVSSWADAIKVEPAVGGDDLFVNNAALIDLDGDHGAGATDDRRVIGLRENPDMTLVHDGGFGVGSAAPIGPGEYPLGHPVKGVVDGMRYLTPGAPDYVEAPADVWFFNALAAEKAGFRRR